MIFELVRRGRWHGVLGYVLFVGMMTAGYYYNVTFVQLGLKDLGERIVGASSARVAMGMALLALSTTLVALLFALVMTRRGWSSRLRAKLRIAFGVILAQLALTAIAPSLRTEPALIGWILAASVALGVGVPAMFSMTVDFIPVADRGYVAAAITALTYLAANLLPGDWRIGTFAMQMLVIMPPGALLLGLLAFGRWPWLDRLADQHRSPAFGTGRFVRSASDGRPHRDRTFVTLLVLMFGIFFVDSLGFLRLIDAPALMAGSWRADEIAPRAALAVAHVVAALVGGVLYTAFPARHLFFWVFGIFALVHFSYAFSPGAANGVALGVPLLYAVAVSLYTVVNFAVWADLSTPRTIAMNAALGVAFSGWTATFLSTAVAIRLAESGIGLTDHLRYVDALALLFFAGMLLLVVFGRAEPRRAT